MEGYLIKINVLNATLPIYRRLEIPAQLDFSQLSAIINRTVELESDHDFVFSLKKDTVTITNYIEAKNVLSGKEKIVNYLEPKQKFLYTIDDLCHWEFEIEVEEALKDANRYPVLIDYAGWNLIEVCDDIYEYNQVVSGEIDSYEDFDISKIEVDEECLKWELMDATRSFTFEQGLIRDEVVNVLYDLQEQLADRNFVEQQVICVHGVIDSYWVLMETKDGYGIELFVNYEDLLDGYYNLDGEMINHAFTHNYLFLLANDAFEVDYVLDEGKLLTAFYNQPGYIPDLINQDQLSALLPRLKELLTGLSHDTSEVRDGEMVVIELAEGKYASSCIVMHEPPDNIERYSFDYPDQKTITSDERLEQQVCIDIVGIVEEDTVMSMRLGMNAIIATEGKYLVKPLDSLEYQSIAKVLIDLMIDFFNEYGVPPVITVRNLNVLYLILNFLKDNNLKYKKETFCPEFDEAYLKAFGLEDTLEELLNDPNFQSILQEFEDELEDGDLEIEVPETKLLN